MQGASLETMGIKGENRWESSVEDRMDRLDTVGASNSVVLGLGHH